MPAVPVHVETMPVLQARYAAAVTPLYQSADIRDGRVARPGVQRKHVFDLENGVRLIVSRERFLDGRIGVHICGSFHDHIRAASVAANEPKLMDPVEALLKMIYTSWGQIAQSDRSAEYIGMSNQQIVHFFVEQAS
jgi:hypothetical protein